MGFGLLVNKKAIENKLYRGGVWKCSVANPDGCLILQTESVDLAMHATKAKVHRVNNYKLRVDAHPFHGDEEGLLTLVGRAAGQPLLVRCIFTMKDFHCGIQKWCEGGPEFLSSGVILGLLGRCGTIGYGFP